MAHPYIFESTFEQGTNVEWDSETDTTSILDFPHYSTLSCIPGIGPAVPYRGAYCMRVAPAGGTADAFVKSATIAVAASTTRHFGFNFYIGNDFAFTADDTVALFELQQAGGTIEASVGLRLTAATGLIEIGIGELAPTSFYSGGLSKGRWYHLDLKAVADSGANNGTLDLYINGVAGPAQVTGLTQTAIAAGVLGLQDQLATTTGTLLFDKVVFDDGQLYPSRYRYPETITITKSQHLFVGPGWIESATILTAGGTLVLHDTDVANTNDEMGNYVDLDAAAGRVSFIDGAQFNRGCYAVLSTNGKAQIQLATGSGYRGHYGPKAHWSPGAIRNYGAKRKSHKLGM